ncbi:MAG TPA: radical SAM protein [Thermodesulforhabdus norvegica]|uniref:Radical SAM protein n=1 Tax=Thermodesulforhabdus norvegica TaxID=39841 RepID=A0A7C0WRA6_9BACT|nr:MAG: SynChlorMet cassette radical SAM/SPASM protein ScmE [Gammaproteobacteria bacterium]HDL89469.1 radical SAM protein [Thermodesulforhabdus norvegica]
MVQYYNSVSSLLRYFPEALAREVTEETLFEPDPCMRTPRSVDISITGKCNLRCKTCYYADDMVARRNLPTKRWLTVMDELGSIGVMNVSLSGGEPMTRKDIYQIIERLVQNRMRFSMNSNGMLFNQENSRFMAETKRCDSIQISIDGSSPEVHDNIRGSGSFTKAVQGISFLQEAGVDVTVRVTINRQNVHDLPNIFRLLYEQLKVASVSTNEAFPRGAAQCNLKELDMTPEDRRVAEGYCIEAAKHYPSLSAMAGPLALGNQLMEIKATLSNGQAPSSDYGGYLRACGGVFNKLDILHDGAVVPCNQLPQMVLGYVGETPLKTIWQESDGLRYMRARQKIPLYHLESCHDCQYQAFCTGGCPAMAYAATGKLTSRDPRSCYRALLGEDAEYVY